VELVLSGLGADAGHVLPRGGRLHEGVINPSSEIRAKKGSRHA
jgi:hypothetical protein